MRNLRTALCAASIGIITVQAVSGAAAQTAAQKIVQSVRDQLQWGTTYDPNYVVLKYPGGDVPRSRGVCTDVVGRALRTAGYDLQQLVHRDILASPQSYRHTGLKRPDRNIDHRRCPVLITYFQRNGIRLTTSVNNSTMWQPGDIVFWKLPSGLHHVGVLTDRRNAAGLPWAVHNLSKPAEEDVLTAYTIIAHFRYPKVRQAAGRSE